MEKQLKVERLTTIEEIDAIIDEWDELHGICTYRSTFNSSDYLWTALKTLLDDSKQLFFIILREQDHEIVAIFPFYRSKITRHHFFQFTYISQAGLNEEADKSYPIIKQGFEHTAWKQFIDYLHEHKNLWQLLYIYEMPEGLQGLQILERHFSQLKYHVKTTESYTSPIIDLSIPWQDFWDEHKKMRKRVRKIQKDYEGSYDFKIIHDMDSVDQYLEQYFELEGRSWKGKENPPVGIASTEKLRIFFKSAYQQLADQNLLVFGLLYCEGKLISGEIAYICGDKVFFGQGCYDPDYKKYSPGMVSTALFLEYFFDKGYDYGDYLGGWASYINPWAHRFMKSFDQVITHLTPKMRLYNFIRMIYRRFKSTAINIKRGILFRFKKSQD